MITYENDLADIERDTAKVRRLLAEGMDITPGEAACLQDAARALLACVESMEAEAERGPA